MWPVEIDRAPDLVDVLCQIARTHVVVEVLHAVLGDDDGDIRVCPCDPFDGIEDAFWDVGDEVRTAHVRVFGIAAVRKQFAGLGNVEPDRIHGVIIQSEIILRAFHFGDALIADG